MQGGENGVVIHFSLITKLVENWHFGVDHGRHLYILGDATWFQPSSKTPASNYSGKLLVINITDLSWMSELSCVTQVW